MCLERRVSLLGVAKGLRLPRRAVRKKVNNAEEGFVESSGKIFQPDRPCSSICLSPSRAADLRIYTYFKACTPIFGKNGEGFGP